MKKFLALLLSIVMLLPAAVVPTAAAASYPSDVSSGRYIEFKAQESINVYKDKACKTRGTSSPSKKYNASIAKNDVCYIYEIDSSYIQVNYPTSSGRRTGYIKRGDLLDSASAEEFVSSSKASVTVYKAQGNSSIAKDDKVWRVDPDKEYSGYYAVIYEARSGKRAYKLGYVTLNDWTKLKETSQVGKVTTSAATTLSAATHTKTITVSATSLEDWCEKINYAERSMTAIGRVMPHINGREWWRGNIITDRKVLETKTVAVKVPNGKQGPNLNADKIVYVELPYKIKYTLHKHTFETKITDEFWGRFIVGLVNQEVVHTQTCECGLSIYMVWQIPDMVVEKVTAGETYKVTSYISAGK